MSPTRSERENPPRRLCSQSEWRILRMTQIDTSRRGFLKSAVAASAAMMSAAAVHAGIPAKSVAKYDETFDVVIIGSGFAGMACALKAGRAGLKVLMIEKMSTVGGNSAICGGNVACPVNPVQKAQGIKDSKELFIADCLKDGLGINHTNLLSTIADRCNDTIQMVVDCGCEFVPNKMLFEGGHSVPRSYEIKAGTGSGYIRPMHEELKKLKNVVIRTRCKFDDFVMEEDGSVAGIVCRTGYRFNNKAVSDDLENKTGKKSVVRATKGVMLAAGGFSRDIFFRQIQDPRVVPTTDSTNQPGATAGVLIKALGIGAAPVQLCWLQFLPYCNPREKGFGVSVNFTNHACMDLGLVVDRKTGRRFMDEHAGRKIKSDALFKVIGTDENYPIAVCDDSIVKAINPSFVKLPLEMGTVKKFDTLEALADHFGIKKDAFLEEVKKFNGFVKAGEDKDFGRILSFNNGLTVSQGPFYGIECCPKIHHTMGGVMINEKAEVISATTQKPIKGLYAGGEVTGGVHGASRLGTVAVIDALTFGMIAGENFAAMK